MSLTVERLLNTIFVKVTTIPLVESLAELAPAVRDALIQRLSYNQPPVHAALQAQPFDEYMQLALLPEISRLTSVTVGGIKKDEQGQFTYHLHTYAETNEGDLLGRVGNFLVKSYSNRPGLQLGGYQVRTHDVPFLVKRFLAHQAPLPQPLRLRDRKPWDSGLLDLADYWSGGDVRQSVALPLLAQALLPAERVSGAGWVRGQQSQDAWRHHQGQMSPEAGEHVAQWARNELQVTMELAARLRDLG